MKTKSEYNHFICIFIIALFLLPTFVYAEEQEIRVVTGNASIRLKPDTESEIIETPPIGSVFGVENKVGEWYEIKFRSRVGMIIIGYIHEKDVEEMKIEEEVAEEIKPAPEKITEIRPPPPVVKEEPRITSQIELVISGGYNLGYSISRYLSYSDIWSGGNLQMVDEHGTLSQDVKKPLGFSGALNYFFSDELGVQLRLDYNSKEKISGVSEYNLSWSWTDGSGPFTMDNQWDVTGDVSSMDLSGNIIFKIPTTGMIAPVISGGVSYFIGELKVNTLGGYALSWIDGDYQYIDYWCIPAKIDASFNGFGFNVGGGANLLFTPNVGINFDARYFIKSEIVEPWEIVTGQYQAENFDHVYLNLDQNTAKEIQEGVPSFKLNPSFFKFSVGLVFTF